MRQVQTGGQAAGALDDAALVSRVLNGDGLAFEAIMRRNNQRLYRIARSIVRNDHEAEDVVQETYVRAYAKLGDFVGPAGLSAWLAKIAVNEALGRLRRRGRVILLDDYLRGGYMVERETTLDMSDTTQPDPEQTAANAELRRLIEDAIDELSSTFRTVFILRAVEQMSVAETAECLGLRPETVKTRFHRARGLMRRTIEARIAAGGEHVFPFAGARCDRIVATVMKRLRLS